MSWLGHGVELAQDKYGATATYRHVLWMLISEALDLLDRVPDQEKRWLSSGTRSGGWSQIGMTREDLLEIERLRVMSSMMPFDGTTKYTPQRNEVDRSVGILEWLRWCSTGDDHRLQKAVVLLAKGAEDAAIKAFSLSGRTRIRQAAYEIRTQAIGRILKGLREDAGIIPSPNGLSFMDARYAGKTD